MTWREFVDWWTDRRWRWALALWLIGFAMGLVTGLTL